MYEVTCDRNRSNMWGVEAARTMLVYAQTVAIKCWGTPPLLRLIATTITIEKSS